MGSSSSPDRGGPLLAARGVRFRYPDGTLALDGLDLGLWRGTLGLLGPNGSGKSTLIRLAADGVAPTEGALELGGPRPRRGPRSAAALDRPAFLEALTGRENLELVARLRGAGGADARSDASEWLDRFTLAPDADRPVGSYSMGMRRRLALARAFASGASLILLDEPLAGLDPEGRAALGRVLQAAAEGGRAVLLSTHDADFAARWCERVAFLLAGRRVAEGTPGELIDRLERETRIEVRVPSGDLPADLLDAPPSGVRVVGREAGRLQLASRAGSAALPTVCDWLVRAGVDIRSVELREPGLADVFFQLTGRALRGDPE